MSVLLLCAIAACATRAPCALGRPYERSELYFGLRRSDGTLVDGADFDAFIASDAIPTLPSGFTLYTAEGRYLAHGRDEREPTRVLVVLHRGEPAISVALEALRARYKAKFAQQAVLRGDAQVCVTP